MIGPAKQLLEAPVAPINISSIVMNLAMVWKKVVTMDAQYIR